MAIAQDSIDPMDAVCVSFPYLNNEQWKYVINLEALLGSSGIVEVLQAGPEATLERVARFQDYERSMLNHLIGMMPTPAASPPVHTVKSPKSTILRLLHLRWL